MQWFLKFIFGIKLYMFRKVPLSIIRSSLPLLYVQWKTPDDGQRNCPKHVEFYSKNKIEKLVHLVGFIIRNMDYFCNIFVSCGLWIYHSVYCPSAVWTFF